MSADNWAICPRCLARAHKAANEARETVMATYGQIPVEEFDAQRSALPVVDPEVHRTFREDYDIWGADEGKVSMSYGGSCTACELSVDVETSKRFWDPIGDGP